MSPETSPKKEFFKKFLVNATIAKIRCVDERYSAEQTNGVQIQGATSGLIDAYIAITGATEDAAWNTFEKAGIPFDGHDDTHHGANGCGYNNKVEKDPGSVGAKKSATAASRLARVKSERILHYQGEHNPKFATINRSKGKTLNTNGILSTGQGTFNLDAWAIDEYAKKLHLSKDQAKMFSNHVIDSYRQTVMTLTSGAISTFIEI